jgi:superfamily I DNA and/or RNA helicase
VQKAQKELASAKWRLLNAQAAAGQTDARLIRAYQTLETAQTHFSAALDATHGLEPFEALQEQETGDQERLDMLRSEIEAIRTAVEQDAKKLVEDAVAIFATLTRLYIDRDLLSNLKWDTVIVDEVSMAMPPLLAYAASRAKKRIVIVGDMYQLPPVVTSGSESEGGVLGTDIFKLRAITEAVDDRRIVPELVKLTTQRRMHPDIS